MTGERKPDEVGTAQRQHELAAYEKLRAEVRRLLAEIGATVNADAVREAVEKATERLRQAGGTPPRRWPGPARR